MGNLSSNEVRLTIKDSRYSNNENISTITFDKSAINSWQEVRIPIMIKDKVIESIKLEFLDNSNTLIKIADMRIYNSSMNNIMIGDENNNNELEKIKKIEYIEQHDTEVKTKNIDDNFYLTEKDLQMTYLGIFKRYGSL
ncbi:MAG: hypothetical protein IKJ02_02490, partial [Tidjanibacter sp.]|nr:hypothetical protein [Tidjanibacter sp.]